MSKSAAVLFCAVLAGGSLWGKDAVQASVTPLGTAPVPILRVNGNPYSPGTFAAGTIQLFYTVNAFQFTAGTFATFQLDMVGANYSANPPAVYPMDLYLVQTGSTNLALSPVPANFHLTAVPFSNSSVVTITIPASVPLNPALNVDGTDLVANLQLAVAPPGSHLDTVTTVQVHILLVHPTSCLRVFDFITDEAFTTKVTSTYVNVNKNGKVTSLNPFGQLSDNIMVVNACPQKVWFDLAILLDSTFQTNPHGNPGNAVFAYMTNAIIEPGSFSIGAFGDGTPKGQGLCLNSVGVPSGSTFLATVHMGLKDDLTPSMLPSDMSFDFAAALKTPAEASFCAMGPLPLAPDPATATLTYTLK